MDLHVSRARKTCRRKSTAASARALQLLALRCRYHRRCRFPLSPRPKLAPFEPQGAPYGYTPFCDNNRDMDGFRFWKTGFWKEHLQVRGQALQPLLTAGTGRLRRPQRGSRQRPRARLTPMISPRASRTTFLPSMWSILSASGAPSSVACSRLACLATAFLLCMACSRVAGICRQWALVCCTAGSHPMHASHGLPSPSRQMAAGDRLRVMYDGLSKDPASLANLDQASCLALDGKRGGAAACWRAPRPSASSPHRRFPLLPPQDLPNYAQAAVPIFSLPQVGTGQGWGIGAAQDGPSGLTGVQGVGQQQAPVLAGNVLSAPDGCLQEWLWCETWCGAETRPQAKTIDLCNNPLTKVGCAHCVLQWHAMPVSVGGCLPPDSTLKTAVS